MNNTAFQTKRIHDSTALMHYYVPLRSSAEVLLVITICLPIHFDFSNYSFLGKTVTYNLSLLSGIRPILAIELSPKITHGSDL